MQICIKVKHTLFEFTYTFFSEHIALPWYMTQWCHGGTMVSQWRYGVIMAWSMAPCWSGGIIYGTMVSQWLDVWHHVITVASSMALCCYSGMMYDTALSKWFNVFYHVFTVVWYTAPCFYNMWTVKIIYIM